MNLRLKLAIISMLFVFGCANSNEQRAKKAIKDYIKSHKETFSYWRPVHFSSLDSTFDRGAEYDRLRSLRQCYWDTAEIDFSKPRFTNQTKIYRLKVDSIKRLIYALKDPKRHTGYKMHHDYFADISRDGIYAKVFYFDKHFKVVEVYSWRDEPNWGYPSEDRYYAIDSIGTKSGER